MIDDQPGSNQPNTQLPASYGIDEVIDPKTTTEAHQRAHFDKLAVNARAREVARSLGYEPLDLDDSEHLRRYFSQRVNRAGLTNTDFRPELIAAVERAEESGVFTSVQCWMPDINRSKKRQMVFVGVIGSEQVSDPTTYYVIDYHVPKGEQVITIEHLRERYRYLNRSVGFSKVQPTRAKIAFGLCLGSFVASVLTDDGWELPITTLVMCFITYCAQWRLTDHEEDFAEEVRVAAVLVGIAQIIAAVVMSIF